MATLKLEVGKYYRARDGQKVGPVTHHPEEQESYRWQVQGLDLNGTVAAWFDSGAVYSTRTSPHDLIAEWTDAPTGPVRTDADATPMLTADNKRLRNAGNALAIAAIHVATEYDGVHRLMLAVADWAKAVADEGGRGDRA